MEDRYLEILEFPKILERLAAYADFSAGQALARALRPTADLEEARRRQQETAEAMRLLSAGMTLSVGGARDIRPLLDECKRGISLQPEDFLEIRATLASARSLRQSLGRQVALAPHLAGLAQRIEDCAHVVAEINRCMDEAGEIRDSASPMLAQIRAALREAHERVLRQLNRLIHSAESAGYLQEPIITQRNGRYVIPLKAEFKGRIPGIIHDQSASGATLFIEPLTTVELNNEWRELQLAEQAEIRRILANLSLLIAQEAPFIERTVGILAELDLIFAKAKYAQDLRAVSPELVPFEKPHPVAGDPHVIHPGSVLVLPRARHPLLDPQTVVPIDVRIGPDYFVLVITGPNTGGKTVALKTVGLLAAMAQAGMAIPAAEGARLSVFDGIYADIGDEQSIEQSLSTFSSHMNNIVDILRRATSHSLVVLDELGAGTDPEEGFALAQAILSHLVARSITTFATTHYSELKIYAHSAPGVQNASVEFDPETLRPTYELTIGLPGRSNALAIARRLGLDESIIADATRRVSAEALQAESLLNHLKTTQQQARRELELAQAARQEAERLRDELCQKLAAIEEARRQVLAEAREQARQELAELRKEIERLRAEAEEARRALRQAPAAPAVRTLSQEVEALEEAWAPVRSPQIPAEEVGPWVPPKVGDRVWIEGLSVEGEVTGVAGDEVELQAGSLRLRLPARQVRVRRQATPAKEPAPSISFDLERPRPPTELDLRGMRAEDALEALERYLDAALLANLPWARIIHGKGTGALRQVVREFLQGYRHLLEFQPADASEGGDGVTIVTFKRGEPAAK